MPLTPYRPERFAIFRLTPVRYDIESGHEAVDFLYPVVQCRYRGNDKEWSPQVVLLSEVGEEGDRLDSLSSLASNSITGSCTVLERY